MICGHTELSKGSSPRMRGAPLKMPTALFIKGIIPADAGSTIRGFQCSRVV